MSRQQLLAAAAAYVDEGGLAADLARLVARRSISQSEGKPEVSATPPPNAVAIEIRGHGVELPAFTFALLLYPSGEVQTC